MSQFHLACLIVLLTSASISVNKTAALDVPLEAQEPQNHLRQNLPDIFLFIFRDTYTILSNTVVVVPGCTLPTTRNIQSDILDSFLFQTTDLLALEIQTDFSQYDTSARTFLWFIDSKVAFR